MILTKSQMALCKPYLPVLSKFGLYPNRQTWVDRATMEALAEIYDMIVDNGKHVCVSGCGSSDFIKRLAHWVEETEIDKALKEDEKKRQAHDELDKDLARPRTRNTRK